MSTHLAGHGGAHRGAAVHPRVLASHWTWLGIGLALAFLVPFVFSDLLEIDRDLYYGVYALSVIALFAGWARETGYDLRAAIQRHLLLAVALGLAVAGLLAVMVVRTDPATARPAGAALAAALMWRGVVYGAADGLLLSAFPILIVFAALTGSRVDRGRRGKVAIGAAALAASIVMTAVYHAGYPDFRSSKMRKPVAGDAIWSVPTLVTLNPVGAPIAHVGLHVSAVLHSSETETFLPPH
jgi:hypothetical protein